MMTRSSQMRHLVATFSFFRPLFISVHSDNLCPRHPQTFSAFFFRPPRKSGIIKPFIETQLSFGQPLRCFPQKAKPCFCRKRNAKEKVRCKWGEFLTWNNPEFLSSFFCNYFWLKSLVFTLVLFVRHPFPAVLERFCLTNAHLICGFLESLSCDITVFSASLDGDA